MPMNVELAWANHYFRARHVLRVETLPGIAIVPLSVSLLDDVRWWPMIVFLSMVGNEGTPVRFRDGPPL